MKCIECGNECKPKMGTNPNSVVFPLQIGWYCDDLSHGMLEWSKEDHIDDVTYLIQELNDLKAKYADLEANFNLLLEKLGV